MKAISLAGTPATPAMLIDVAGLIAAYYAEVPDPSVAAQRVAFGTSGHRGSALDKTFNERHVLAISQAICLYRKQHSVDGPLFLGILFRNRPHWSKDAAVGKTVVSSALIDRVTARVGRQLYEVPVGFKWFVDGLFDGSLGFAGEESAGASFSRIDGSVWTTDKDGIVPGLLAAEITARTDRDPGELYHDLTRELGEPASARIEAPANAAQKRKLAKLSPEQLRINELGGEKVHHVLANAPGNDAPIGGIKVIAASGWFAARPSVTEDIYKIYAESFRGHDHLRRIIDEGQAVVNDALAAPVTG